MKQIYTDPILGRIIKHLQDNMDPSYVKTWHQGDVLLLPKRDLPAVSVAYDYNNIIASDNLHDESNRDVVISLIVDHTEKSMWKSWDIMAGQMEAYEITAGMEPLDLNDKKQRAKYIEGCMAAVLTDRTKQDLGNGIFLNVTNNNLNFEYGIGVERRGEGIFSIEASCRIVVTVDTNAINPYGANGNTIPINP